MVDDLGTIVRVELSTDSIDATISYCEGIDIFEEIGGMLTTLKDDIQSGAEDGIEDVADKTKSLQEDFITSNGSIVTGELIGSITVDATSSTEYYIGTPLDYAKYVEYGRGAVVPVNASILHFEIDGDDVFTNYSGPSQRKPFVEPAFQQINSEAVNIIDEAINNAIN